MPPEKIFEYTIKSGDTAAAIAKLYKTDLATIQRLNPEIKDINLIYKGAFLKLPKLTPVDAPEEYKAEFDTQLEELYKGTYGIVGAEDKLVKTLEKKYPSVDSWTDLVANVPPDWTKIAFPKETISKPKDLPVESQSDWQRLVSLVETGIKEPGPGSKIIDRAWDIFRGESLMPTPEEIFEKAKAEIREHIIAPATEIFETLSERVKEIPSIIQDVVENPAEYGKIIRETIETRWKKGLAEERKEIAKDISLAQEGLRGLPLIGKSFIEADKQKLDFKVGQEQAKTKVALEEIPKGNQFMAQGYFEEVKENILRNEVLLKSIGIIVTEDLYGFLEYKDTGEDLQTKEIDLLLEAFPESGPLVEEAFLRLGEDKEALQDLTISLVENANKFWSILSTPEVQQVKNLKELKEELSSVFELSSYLEAVDPTLLILDQELDRMNRSVVDLEKYYEKNIPKWWEEIEKNLGVEATALLKLDRALTAEEEKRFDAIRDKTDSAKLQKARDVLKLIDQSQVYYNIENNLAMILEDPKVQVAIMAIFERDPDKYSKEIHDLKLLMKNGDWWSKNKKYLETKEGGGFFGKIAEAMTVQDYQGLAAETKASQALSVEQRDATLRFLKFQEDSTRIRSWLGEAWNKMGKAGELWYESSRQATLDAERKEQEKLKSYLEHAPFTWLFPFTEATKEDAWTGFKITMGLVWNKIKKQKVPLVFPDISDDPTKIQLPNSLEIHLPKIEKLPLRFRTVEEIFSESIKSVFMIWEEIAFRWIVPAINTWVATNLDLHEYDNIKEVMADMAASKVEKTQASLRAFKMIALIPPDEVAPPELPKGQALAISAATSEYYINAFKYFQSPQAYLEIKIDKDTKIEMDDGKVRIGSWRFETLDSREQFWTMNPELQNSHWVKKGQTITIPRFTPLPRFLDVLPAQNRFEFYRDHPGFATAIDEFVVWLTFPDPFMKGAQLTMKGGSAARIAGTRLAKSLNFTAPAKAKNLFLATSAGRALQRSKDISEQILNLATLRGVDWEKLPSTRLAQRLKEPIDRRRAWIGQSTVLKGLPEELQATTGRLMADIQKDTKLAFLQMDVFDVVRRAAKKMGKSEKEIDDILKTAILGTKPPEAAIREIFKELNLTRYDILEFGDLYPGLKDPAEALYRAGVRKLSDGVIREEAFTAAFNKLSDYGQEWFTIVYSDWKLPAKIKEGTQWIKNPAKKILNDADYQRIKEEYLQAFKKSPEYGKVADDIRISDRLLKFVEKDREIAAEIYETAKVVSRLPVDVRISEEVMKFGVRSKLMVAEGRLTYFTDPTQFPLREGEVIGDLMAKFTGLRLDKFSTIEVATIGNWLKKGKELYSLTRKPLTMMDNLETDFFLNFLKKEKANEVLAFLQRISPDTSIGTKDFTFVSTRLSGIEKFGIETPIGQSVERGITKTFIISNTVEKIEKARRKIEVGPETLKLFFRRAAWLDSQKPFSGGRQLLRDYKNVLEASSEVFLRKNPTAQLDLLLLRTFENKPILPSFSHILLLEDLSGPTQMRLVMNFIEDAAKHASNKFHDSLMTQWRTIGKFEKITKAPPEIMNVAYVGRKLKDVQKTYKLGINQGEINRILPRLYGHIPSPRLPEAEMNLKIANAMQESAIEARAISAKMATAKGREIITQWKKLGEIKLPSKEIEVAFGTTFAERAFLIEKEKDIIRALVRQKKIILRSDITDKDKIVNAFIKEIGGDLKIINPPTAKELHPTAQEVISVLKENELIWEKVNPGIGTQRVLTEQGLLELMAGFPRRLKLPKGNLSAERYQRELIRIEKDYQRKFDSWIEKAHSKYAQTQEGKRQLRELLNTDKAEQFLKDNVGDMDKQLRDKLIQDFGISDWGEGMNLGFSIVREGEGFVRPLEFWEELYGQINIALDWLKAKGLDVYRNKKGKIVVIRLRPDSEVGLAAVQERMRAEAGRFTGKFLQETRTLVKTGAKETVPVEADQFLSKLAEALHIDTYDNPLAFRKYFDQLDKIRIVREEHGRLVRFVALLKDQIEFLKPLTRAPAEFKSGEVRIRKLEKILEKARARAIKIPDAKLRFRVFQKIEMRERPARSKQIVIKRTAQRAEDYTKRLAEREKLLRQTEARLTRLEKRMVNFEGSAKELLVIVSNPLFPGESAHVSLLKFLGGERFTTKALHQTQRRIIETEAKLKTLNANIKEALKVRAPDRAFQKAKFAFLQELTDLKKIRDLIPDIVKMEKAGVKLSWRELYEYSKGRIPKSLSLKFEKLNKAAAIKFPSVKSPIPLSKENQKLFEAIPEIQNDIKKLVYKDEVFNKIAADYLPRSTFLSPKYLLPIVRTETPSVKGLEEMLKQLDRLGEKRVKVLVDLTGNLSRQVAGYPQRFRIVQIPELNRKSLASLTPVGEIPFKREAEGFAKLREIFINNKSIVIWDQDIVRAVAIKERLMTLLPANRKNLMKAAQDLFNQKEALAAEKVKGFIARLPRRDTEYIRVRGGKSLAIKTTEALEPPKAVKFYGSPYEIDAARTNLETAFKMQDWMPEARYVLGGSKEKIPTLILASESKMIPETTLKRLVTMAQEQGAEFYIPRGKEAIRSINVFAKKKIPVTLTPLARGAAGEMQFRIPVVRNTLRDYGAVYTARKFKMVDKNVWVAGIGLSERKFLKAISYSDELKPYLHLSGFDSVDDWFVQLRRFIKPEEPIWLYEVKLKNAIPYLKTQPFRSLIRTGQSEGERIIREYLGRFKVPVKYLDTDLNPALFKNPSLNFSKSAKLPPYLVPIGDKFDDIRAAIIRQAKDGKRIFTTKDEIQNALVRDYMKKVDAWLKDKTKYTPKLFQSEQYAWRRNGRTLLAKWKQIINRDKAKENWMRETKSALDKWETDYTASLLEASGLQKLSPRQLGKLMSLRREYENTFKMMEYIMNFDAKPGWITGFWEKLSEKIAKAQNLKYARDKNMYFLQGFPISPLERMKFSTGFIEAAAKFAQRAPQFYHAILTPISFGRSIWIRAVLYWRVAWYLKNTYDDGIRGAMAAKSIGYWFKAQSAFAEASGKFLQKFVQDIRAFPTFPWKPTNVELRELAAGIGGKDGTTWVRKLFGKPVVPGYKVFEPQEALKVYKEKGVWGFLNKPLWKSEMNRMMDFEMALKDGPMITMRSEYLTKEILDHLVEAGLFQVTSDPIYLRKMISMMADTTWWQRLKKRAFILEADIEVYAAYTETIRRQILVHDLLFQKAMTIAQTKAKTWGYLFNYRDLTIVGKTFRYFFPFYAFNVNSVRLYLSILAKGGPRYWLAARGFLDAWSEATRELPEWARMRIAIGNDLYWYPWSSVAEILWFLKDPIQGLKDFAENPTKVPLGLGWDPFIGLMIQQATDQHFWDVSNDYKRNLGWTDAEIEKDIKDQNLKRDISGEPFWLELMMTYLPFTKVLKSIGEVDMHMIMDETSIWHSKKIREIAKQFGLNIMKWDDVDRFRQALYDAPPHLRKLTEQQMKAENPMAWDALQNYFARVRFLRASKEAKDDPVKASYDLQTDGWLQIYFDLEEQKEGAGKRWLQRNPEAKEAIDEFFEVDENTNPWRMWQSAKYNRGTLASEIGVLTDRIFKEEVIQKAQLLGLDIPFAIPGNKQEFTSQFFDERGGLKISTTKELEVIMGKGWVDKIINMTKDTWQNYIKNVAQLRYNEWLYQAATNETPEARRLAEKMAKWQLLLPEGIGEMSDKEAQPHWATYWKYFENYFTEGEKQDYYLMLKERRGEWYYEYRMRVKEYIERWGKIFDKGKGEGDGFMFFDDFYSQPEWFQQFYFVDNPNKEKWYPFAQEWMTLLNEIEMLEKATGIFQTVKRKEASDFFWSHENIVRDYWDKDNPGFYEYMKTWQKIMAVTETNPEKYFVLFHQQSVIFRERFFKQHPEKRVYYPFLTKWVSLIKEDKENWDKKGIRTSAARDYFWSADNKSKREAYGREKIIAPGVSILDYLKLWDKIFYKTEDNIEDYFDLFYKQPDWFKDHFFLNNPNKAVYYPVIQEWVKRIKQDEETLERTGTSGDTARPYYEKHIKGVKKVRDAWETVNPGVINYLDAWDEIITKTESNPEVYFEEFYKQPVAFRERFFRNNRNKAVYYPFLSEWAKKIKEDQENWDERGIRTHKARDQFNTWKDALAGKLYAKDNMITKDKSVIDYLGLWQKVMEQTEENPKEFFEIFDTQPDWFKDHYFKNHPDRKIYYPFAKKLGEQTSDNFSRFFWKTEYATEREAWEREKPGFLDYMTFWKKLGALAETGQWDLYFNIYFLPQNEKHRLRHERNNPDVGKRFIAFRDYQKLVSITWEDRRDKREFLKAHPELLEWWSKDLSEDEAAIREKVESYYNLLDNVPAQGKGRDYYLEVRKWEDAADRYLQDNPEVLIFLQKRSSKYTGQKPEIFSLVSSYFAFELPSERQEFIEDHPELKVYFNNLKPPGIRDVLVLQDRYFALDSKYKEAFLDIHPELIDYWEVSKMPWSYYFNPKAFEPYQETIDKVEETFDLYIKKQWVDAERLREALPTAFSDPGTTDEDEWLRTKIYGMAMETWAKLTAKNDLMSIYFFRQLPSWIRDIYYTRHPEKQYLSKHPLSRFIEEPLRIWEALNPELGWAYRMIYKYGKNIPFNIEERVRNIMLSHGVWKERAGWERADWDKYWADRSKKLNEVTAFDLENLPLLRKEAERVVRAFSLRLRQKPFSAPRTGVIHPFF